MAYVVSLFQIHPERCPTNSPCRWRNFRCSHCRRKQQWLGLYSQDRPFHPFPLGLGKRRYCCNRACWSKLRCPLLFYLFGPYLFGDTEPIVRMFPYTKGSRNRVEATSAYLWNLVKLRCLEMATKDTDNYSWSLVRLSQRRSDYHLLQQHWENCSLYQVPESSTVATAFAWLRFLQDGACQRSCCFMFFLLSFLFDLTEGFWNTVSLGDFVYANLELCLEKCH